MKKYALLMSAIAFILATGTLFACGGDRCSRQYYNYSYSNTSSCNSCNGCNSCGNNSGEDMACDCVDPSCGWVWEHNCSSQRTCCEAFGNIAGEG